MSQSVCKGCKDRAVGCHITCERYIKWKKEQEKKKRYERRGDKYSG